MIVGKDDASFGSMACFLLLGLRLPPGVGKVFLDARPAFLVQHQRNIQHLADGFPGQIVRRGPQPSGNHHHVAAAQRQRQHLLKAGVVVAHRGLIQQLYPIRGQLPGQKLAVRIENIPEQQFRAHCEYFSVHNDLQALLSEKS